LRGDKPELFERRRLGTEPIAPSLGESSRKPMMYLILGGLSPMCQLPLEPILHFDRCLQAADRRTNGVVVVDERGCAVGEDSSGTISTL
jgi:hypothetical protein